MAAANGEAKEESGSEFHNTMDMEAPVMAKLSIVLSKNICHRDGNLDLTFIVI